ncbi:hypothetical protein SG34_030865 [Thalassomonas viridans]|uniref:PEP-CTERM protein-sorting domain-containing protein n=1 Tax=Thalassomonas viridans TaxID=137584 RepID=A0AAE9Z9S5_9GAMM|nr:hypothetical protein [Thalassomonas viridans]WDE09168.1 hypothetical protein SG34_030865 [Thalassomonas viridans]
MRFKLIVASLLITSATSIATPIDISNPGLDAQPLSDGAFIHNVQGWAVIDGSAGIYNPPESVIFGEGGSGSYGNTLFLNGDSLVTQTLNTNLTSDTDYKLIFEVGDRLDLSFPNYIVRIKAGGNTIFTAINPLIPNGGDFSSVTLNFSTGTTVPTGVPMVIELEVKGSGQALFDNFSLDAQTGTGHTSNSLGDWNHPSLGGTVYNANTVYQAPSDGFIIFTNGGTCKNHNFHLQLGDNPSPEAIVSRVQHYGSMMSPVKAGQYWHLLHVPSSGACSSIIGFIPLK